MQAQTSLQHRLDPGQYRLVIASHAKLRLGSVDRRLRIVAPAVLADIEITTLKEVMHGTPHDTCAMLCRARLTREVDDCAITAVDAVIGVPPRRIM